MPQIKVLIPGPWWDGLCYDCDSLLPAGVRVSVPFKQGVRVGICVGEYTGDVQFEKKKVLKVLDESPVVSPEYLQASERIARAFLCSQSDVLRSLLPSLFWKNANMSTFFEEKGDVSCTEFFYRYSDKERYERYRKELISCKKGALCIFPESSRSKLFYKSLKGLVPSERLIFWPRTGGKTAIKAWNAALSCKNPVIIGGPKAASAPMSHPGLIIVDEECNPSLYLYNLPQFSLRSFAAARGRISFANVILGGRIPSSSVFDNADLSQVDDKNFGGKNFSERVVSIYKVPKVPFKGIIFPLPMSDVVIRETVKRVSDGKVVFWLLDRRGVSSCIRCAECGEDLQCSKCGRPLVYEKGYLRCPSCNRRMPIPDVCPLCGGYLLQGTMPGLETILPMAKQLVQNSPVYVWHQGNPSKESEKKKIIKSLNTGGGLVLGSRSALSLLDYVNPSMVCWLDADAEQYRPSYSSKFYAYSMFLESCWRGASSRDVVFQSRYPQQQCIKALSYGWRYFWCNELTERAALGFPPVSYLVEISLPKRWGNKSALLGELSDAGFVPMQSESENEFSILAEHIVPLRRVLEKYFDITRSRYGFPTVRVYLD